MKNLIKTAFPAIFLIIMIISFNSCVAVVFKTAQPQNSKSLPSFPKELLGTFVDEEADTVIVTECCFEYGNDNSVFSQNIDSLSKGTLELTRFDEFYILNQKDETGWFVLLIKPGKNSFSAYFIDMDSLKSEITSNDDDMKSEKIIIEKIKKITPVQKINPQDRDNHFYLINPTPDQLRKLIKGGFFVKVNEFKKIEATD
ncbi:MAG: hypothetical protein ACM3PT_06705 [Deltaproteobacteria bacterium]